MNIIEKLKNLSRRTKLLVIIVWSIIVLVFFSYLYLERKLPNDELLTENAVALEQQEASTVGLPMRLKIPSINIDVAIEYVGVTADGAMDIPKSTEDVGWFELGSRPGEEGNAVIAGHYGLYAGKPSIFDNLHELKSGDKIIIEDDKGESIFFVVRESRSYDPNADATEVFSSDDELSHLNLITCEGTWNKDEKSYSKRLVVFADKE
jgi:LPXTG-site transpeptidase (sortase) family protein